MAPSWSWQGSRSHWRTLQPPPWCHLRFPGAEAEDWADNGVSLAAKRVSSVFKQPTHHFMSQARQKLDISKAIWVRQMVSYFPHPTYLKRKGVVQQWNIVEHVVQYAKPSQRYRGQPVLVVSIGSCLWFSILWFFYLKICFGDDSPSFLQVCSPTAFDNGVTQHLLSLVRPWHNCILFSHLARFLEFSKELSKILILPSSFATSWHFLQFFADFCWIASWYALRPVPRPVALAGRLGHDAAGAACTGGAAWDGNRGEMMNSGNRGWTGWTIWV